MPPQNLPSACQPMPFQRKLFARGCSLSLALLCAMAELHASQHPTVRPLEPDPSSSGKEPAGSLSDAQHVFDATVRPRLRALLALSTTELGERECANANAKEPLRGRLDPAVVLAANEQLNLPMGGGSVLSVAGRPYLFCLEPHYHPPGGGISPEGWHKGVTVYHASAPKEQL